MMTEGTGALTLSFVRSQPHAAARVLDAVETAAAASFLRAIPVRAAAPVLARMQPDQAARAIAAQDAVHGAALVREMPYLDCVTVLRLVGEDARAAVFAQLPARLVRDVEASLHYPRETVGAWTDFSIAALRDSSRVAEALQFIRRNPDVPIDHVFVLGAGRQLEGAVSVAVLLGAAEGAALADLPVEAVAPLSNRALLGEVLELEAWDHFSTLPVVGRKGNVLGGLSRAAVRRGIADRRAARSPVRSASVVGILFDAWLLSAAGLVRALMRPDGR